MVPTRKLIFSSSIIHRVFVSSILFLFFFAAVAFSGVIQQGEKLTYEVSYLGVKLGSIKVVTEGTDYVNGKQATKVVGYIESYSGIPFVSIKTVYTSWLDPTVSFSHRFLGRTKDGKHWNIDDIVFNYEKNQIKITNFIDKIPLLTKIYNSSKKWNDGLSLFFLSRNYLKMKRSLKIPSFVSDTSNTTINFLGREEYVEIDAVDYPIKTLYFTGNAEYSGVYGFSGKFKGWFSDDDARVPIRAEMKVYVGSVDIELIEWERAGWLPPK